MNPPTGRAPSRFVRGRARGGGAYRPYFYFRRNGQTIPAKRGGGAGREEQPNRFFRQRRGNIGRGAGCTANAIQPNTDASVLDSTFFRPENFAAPEDALQVQSCAVEAPVQCPGWGLYFHNETYAESSDLAKRIKVVEAHYSDNVACYDLMKIQRKCHFKLQAKAVTSDEKLQKAWPTLVQDFQMHPLRTLATFGAAMYAAVSMATIDASLSLQPCSRSLYVPRYTRPRKIYVRPIGFMNANMISFLSSAVVDTMYCLRGSVATVGAVEAPASWIAYNCSRCRQEQALKQTGYFVSRPYSCKRNGCLAKKGFVEQRASPFTRITPKQIIRLAEKNLQALVDFNAKLPEFLDIELRHDLVDSVASGQEIIVAGVLKMRPLAEEDQQSYQGSSTAGQIYLKASSIVDARHINPGFSQRDLDAIAMINGEPDTFKLLVHSLAPEIHGQELVKAGVLLSLFGGAGSQLHDDAEINVLLVGDPGLGKSQMLQMCAKISEKGFLVNAKQGGAANNQLSASIKGRTHHNIDTGAMIFANNGHCSIDDIDRLASQQETLLQVMQSKIISLPFPSTYATFTTPTTIIATANSLRGHYDQSKLLTGNIRIHPALLRQFHLIFLLLDKPSKDLDTSLTEHIKALHAGAKKSSAIAARFAAKPKTNNSMTTSMIDLDLENDENYDLGERLKLKWLDALEEEELDLLPPLLIKKFIAYARMQVKPLLNAEAAEMLKSFYMDLRGQQNEDKYCAVSTNQLEGLIRLTQARARIDFSSEATKAHVRDVLCIVRQSLADTSIDNYTDINPATAVATGSQNSMVKKFIQMLQLRSNAVGRRIFDFEELKDMARHAGISCGVTNLVDIVNLQGFLLKKGPNLYEVMLD